jgi:hypothetical protein
MKADNRYPDPYDDLITSICALSIRSRRSLIQWLDLDGKNFLGMIYV